MLSSVRHKLAGGKRLLNIRAFCLIGIGLITFFSFNPTQALSTVPSYTGDFPDPFILSDAGQYWAYSTGSSSSNLQVSSSQDLATWSQPTDPMPALPGWATPGMTWAPSVIRLGGTYVMYYTTHSTTFGKQCISVATSNSPAGPFVDQSSSPLVCQAELGGSIDPNVFQGPDGGLYLLWKSDGSAIGQVSIIWGQQLVPDGHSLTGQPTQLLTGTGGWQNYLVESPTMAYYGGQFYLFYSGNFYENANYGVGYATCQGPLGGCTDQSTTGPWLGNTGGLVGPGAGNVFTDAYGRLRFSYHSWVGGVGYSSGGSRPMRNQALILTGGVPQLQ